MKRPGVDATLKLCTISSGNLMNSLSASATSIPYTARMIVWPRKSCTAVGSEVGVWGPDRSARAKRRADASWIGW
jgi:hypothetical protein